MNYQSGNFTYETLTRQYNELQREHRTPADASSISANWANYERVEEAVVEMARVDPLVWNQFLDQAVLDTSLESDHGDPTNSRQITAVTTSIFHGSVDTLFLSSAGPSSESIAGTGLGLRSRSRRILTTRVGTLRELDPRLPEIVEHARALRVLNDLSNHDWVPHYSDENQILSTQAWQMAWRSYGSWLESARLPQMSALGAFLSTFFCCLH